MLSFDTNIEEVAAIKDQLETLLTSLGDQAVKKMMGEGNTAQFMGSIIYSIDMIFIAFLGSAVFGFLTLMLFAWKDFITIMTYLMVFFLMIVLLIGAFIVNKMYWDSMIAMYDMAPTTCFTEVATKQTFVFLDTFSDAD